MKPLSRRRRLLERQWPWAVVFSLITLVTWILAWAIDTEMLTPPLEANLRGHTLLGVLAGLWAVFLAGAAFWYSLRKRAFENQPVLGAGSVAAWLWSHVYLGLLALVAAFAHSGYGAISLRLSSGKVLLVLFVLLIGSGIVWRLIYRFVPPRAAKSIGNYSEVDSSVRAEALKVEIEKLAAGRSPALHDLKNRLLAGELPAAAVQQAAHALPANDIPLVPELQRLANTRQEFIRRIGGQKRYRRWLQVWRVLHVPLSLMLFLALPVHVLFAYDLPEKLLYRAKLPGAGVAFAKADDCAQCHAKIVAQWKTSMHAHAMTSPVMIAQSNQVLRASLAEAQAPDPKKICVNCHGPIGAALIEDPTLPLTAPGVLSSSGLFGEDSALLNEGVTCVVCHQFSGESRTGGGGLSDFADGLRGGRHYFGSISDPVGNAYHRSSKGKIFDTPEELCRNCHSVQYDKNGDGKLEKGTDLVLQTLFDEWSHYRQNGGTAGCLDCHMPVTAERRVAESALYVLEQDRPAPPRRVRDHSFIGVDVALDRASDPQGPARRALLSSAATLRIDAGSIRRDPERLRFEVSVTNSGSGHNLPGGFAFVRQMWLEILVLDGSDALLFESGVVRDPSHDLCDASIALNSENPLSQFVQGCSAADPDLVNFQQLLVTGVELASDPSGQLLRDERGSPILKAKPGAVETPLQTLDAGPVARVRPATNTPTPTLAPGQSASFPYAISLTRQPKAIVVRLKFRPLPPYLLRALDHGSEGKDPALGPLVSRIPIETMTEARVELP